MPLEMVRTFLIEKRSNQIKIQPKSLQYAFKEVRRAFDEIAMPLIGTILEKTPKIENHTKLLIANFLVAGPPLNQPTLRIQFNEELSAETKEVTTMAGVFEPPRSDNTDSNENNKEKEN